MRRRDYLSGLTAATFALAGCAAGDGSDGGANYGGGGGDGGETTSATTTSAQPTSTAPTTTTGTDATTERDSAQAVYPDYSWSALDDAAATATDAVTMRGSAFHPLVARASTGTEVTWTNEDGYGHTVTIPALGVDRRLGGGEETAVAVDEAGTYDYVCEKHPPSMLGRLVVVEGAVTTAESTTTTTSESTGGGGY